MRFPGADRHVEAPVYDWATLPAGTALPGPALVAGPDTTVVVPPDAHVELDDQRNVRLDPQGASRSAEHRVRSAAPAG